MKCLNCNKIPNTVKKFFKIILPLKLFRLCKLNLSKYHNSFFISFLLHTFILLIFFIGGYQFYYHHQDKKINFVVIDDIKIAKIANYQTEKVSEDDNNYSDSRSNILEQHNISQNTMKENSIVVEEMENKKKYKPSRSPNIDLKKAQRNVNRNINIPSRKPMNSNNEKKISSILLSIEDRKKYTLDKGQEQKGLLGRSENKDVKDDNAPITASIIDSIKGQFSACWTLPAGVTNGKNMTVVLFLELDKKGNVLKVNHKHNFRYNRDSLYRAFVDSAIRAVYRCSPIIGLEKVPYSEWANIEMIFDPELMF
ncbi:hypothetical protein GUI12_04325 [Anaplasmataceae bacterium AB001_6]|nr:hypothetical protein GUI12_04325 [Anaplasmataceae bacterium AB001_6]